MKSVMQITLCVGLLIIIAYVTLSWAQQKPPQPKSVSVSENSWVPGLLPHGEVKDGLAAFLLCHRDCFKVGQAIPLSYGIVNIGSGLRRETNLQEADENAEFKIRIWWLQNEPELRWNYSWFEVTGPDGQDVPYHGGKDALDVFNKVRESSLSNPTNWFKLGLTLYDGRYYKEALETFQQTHELSRKASYQYLASLVWQGHILRGARFLGGGSGSGTIIQGSLPGFTA